MTRCNAIANVGDSMRHLSHKKADPSSASSPRPSGRSSQRPPPWRSHNRSCPILHARPHGYAMAFTTQTCDQEPIHALGMIQGHGALIAFDTAGHAVSRSTNAGLLLGAVPELGMTSSDAHFDQVARDALARALANPELSHDGVECIGA